MSSTGDTSFIDRVQETERSLRVRLCVLVWGPGQSARAEWYRKRLSIVTAIRDENPNYDVQTSEDIFGADPPEVRDDIETAQRELIHAEHANLIIALIIGSPLKQGGVYRELDVIASSGKRELRDKTWIFHPTGMASLRRFQSGALANFREDHRIPCSPATIADCESIRKACVDKANIEYRQLRLDQLHAVIGR